MRITYLILLVLNNTSYADTIYDCRTVGSSDLSYDYYKDKIEASSNTREGIKITFVVTKRGALLKGNSSQSELKKVSDTQFIETAMLGNVILWTLIKIEDKKKVFLFQNKAYKLVGASTFTTMYECE